MSTQNKVRLTRERIDRLPPPASGEITLWDTDVLGLGVRCLPSGVKTYIVAYRAMGHAKKGGEWKNLARRVTLGKVNAIRLEDAREAALDIRGAVLKGQDPVAQRRADQRAAKRPRINLGTALDRYSDDLARRHVADRRNVVSSLRRHLLGHAKDVPVAELDRRTIVEAIESLEKKALAGAARALRGNASTFLKWCADRGMIAANPLQGYRTRRTTRAERLAQPGRDLSDAELKKVWQACEAEDVSTAFGKLVRILILTGQRRKQTSQMRWADLDEAHEWWHIPAENSKNGIAHDVPLPALARNIIESMPRFEGCEYVFTTRGKAPISGWSKLASTLRDSAGLEQHWILHDLRRTFRSGLTRLGVDYDVAETMISHRPEKLRAIYDRDQRLDARRDAAERWANHVRAVVDPEGRANVVPLREAAG